MGRGATESGESLFLPILSLIGCGLSPALFDTGGRSAADVDRGSAVEVSTYPSADQDRILVYTGHDGGLLRPFVQVRTAWESDEWTVRDREDFPDDLRAFRLIVLVGTGSAGSAMFADEHFEALSGALQRGTRIVVLQEPHADGQCGSEAIDALVDKWQVPFNFAEMSASIGTNRNEPQSFGTVRAGEQITEQVQSLSMTAPCTVTAGGTWLVRDADQNSLVSAFRPGNGGDLVFVGDVDVLRSTVEWSEMNDNILFARNLAQVVP